MLIQQRLKTHHRNEADLPGRETHDPRERLTDIEKNIGKQFDEVEVEKMMKKAGVSYAARVRPQASLLGTSLERERRAFIERTLAGGWVNQQIKARSRGHL